ncbi:phosphotransferase [Pseudomonas sp. NPDC007930]|uniref:phosphotransferase n=1 Tax=Pseudomonas sp. NPDC007930 TaxID=3364417 RepID=UPI0036EB0EE0
MRALADADYQALRQGAEVIEADASGDKVLRLADGNFIKLFRRKRLVTSAALLPYARRFALNAGHLARRGIPCPTILAIWRVPSIRRDLVHYQPLPGSTLRQVIAAGEGSEALLAQLGAFVARLHEGGVYFRSLHLGNVVRTPSGELGLIDLADMRAYPWALRAGLCLRNFQHMLRYEQDRDWLMQGGGVAFLQAYAQHSSKPWNSERLAKRLG